MKIVLSLLEQFITLKPGLTPADLAAGITQLGHEVEAISTGDAGFPGVVVGKILERVPHPNADRLGVCTVDAGEGATRQIVCGAPNARAGLTVAVALPGATLPGEFKITETSIRGVESKGMICSQRELGMGTDHTGIWEMDTDAAAGTPLDTVLGPAETVLDLSITPNRGDCFSHLGIARDLAALGLGTLKEVFSDILTPCHPDIQTPHVATTTPDCPSLNLMTVSVPANGPSPRAVQKQLEAAGLRPKNMLVDATNLTMIMLGQPMHAYDATKVRGGIRAAAAKGGESYQGLAETKLTLAEGDIIIEDDSGIIGLGGILGGEESAVEAETTAVVLEAAYFNPARIAVTGQKHQLQTDARSRFERGVDPALCRQAILYCADLIRQWSGGVAAFSAVATAGNGAPAPQPISYNPAFFETFIGHNVPADRQKSILESLGFTVEESSSPPALKPSTSTVNRQPSTVWYVTPPTYRTYMTTPEDLTEEILRVEGYEKATPKLPSAMPGQFQVNSAPVTLDLTARRAVAAAGFLEVITYSFIGREVATKFAEGKQLIELANPLAQTEMTTMRPTLVPGLLAALKGNFAKSDPTPRLAEVGKAFDAKGGEKLMAAGVLVATGARHWRSKEAQPDVFTAKAAAYEILGLLGAPAESGTVTAKAPGYYHPGRSGTLAVGPYTLAHFGELHPAYLKGYDLDTVAAFELHLEPLLKLTTKPRPWQASPFPPVKRDLAFLLPRSVAAGEVVAAIRAVNRDLLRSVEVFDSYRGGNIPSDKQSLAVSLTLQSAGKTLAEADIATVLDAAIKTIQQKLGGELRS